MQTKGMMLAAAVASEYLFNVVTKREQTVGDLSAVLTGLLLALNLSTNTALWECAVGSIFAIVLVKCMFGGIGKNFANRAGAEKSLEELFAGEVPKIEKGLSWISVFASTAPLLGLLGTVMGMIELFDVITMHGTSDPKLLAGGISVALVTTEAGLIVAIPLQLLHTFLVNRADALRGRMEKAGLAVLNALWIKEG